MCDSQIEEIRRFSISTVGTLYALSIPYKETSVKILRMRNTQVCIQSVWYSVLKAEDNKSQQLEYSYIAS